MEELEKNLNDKQNRKMYIFGAGTVADLFWIYLKKRQLQTRISGFVVSKKKNNPEYKYSLEVFELGKCLDELKRSYIFMAVQHVFQGEILESVPLDIRYNFIQVDVNMLLNDIYENVYRYPIAKNKILFDNMKGQGYGCNPKYIAQKLIEIDIHKKLDLVWIVQKNAKYDLPSNIRTVEIGTEEYYYEIATSKIWIDNVRKDFDIRKREGQYYIQAWHGAAPIKRVEKDVLHSLSVGYIENAQNDSKMADFFLSGSSFYTELYKKSFWYNGMILEYGLPRHDVFFQQRNVRQKVCNYYNLSEDIGIVMYAPTFRDSYNMNIYDLDIDRTTHVLKERFGHEFVFFISKHPNNRYQDYTRLDKELYIDVASYEDFQELLVAADVLITDYSGCMYDFSFLKKPIFLYQRDFAEYMKERNFYVKMDELPYPRAYNQKELEKEILEFNEQIFFDKVDAFLGKMGNFDKGKAAESVVRVIMNLLESEKNDS